MENNDREILQQKIQELITSSNDFLQNKEEKFIFDMEELDKMKNDLTGIIHDYESTIEEYKIDFKTNVKAPGGRANKPAGGRSRTPIRTATSKATGDKTATIRANMATHNPKSHKDPLPDRSKTPVPGMKKHAIPTNEKNSTAIKPGKANQNPLTKSTNNLPINKKPNDTKTTHTTITHGNKHKDDEIDPKKLRRDLTPTPGNRKNIPIKGDKKK
jgi:hypothetical protein